MKLPLEATISVEPEDLNPTTQLIQARARIINSVLNDGLMSSFALQRQGGLHLPSSDRVPSRVIEGALLHFFPSGTEPYEDIEDILYGGDRSCISVICERSYDNGFSDPAFYLSGELDPESVRTELGERVKASFMIVLNTDRPHAQKVEPHEFLSILFPFEIWKEYLGENPDIKLDDRIRIVTGDVQRKLCFDDHWDRPKLPVPDYENHIINISEKIGHTLWLHAVRLPTAYDLKQSNPELAK